MTRAKLMELAVWAQGGLILAALGLAWLTGVRWQAMYAWNGRDLAIGLVAVLPMLVVAWLAEDLRDIVSDLLGAALDRCHWYDLVFLAGMAGLGEELMFRGVLSGWLDRWHPWAGWIVSNLIFGFLHFLSWLYFFLATGFGLYFSWLTESCGERNLVRATVAHAVYDYIAFQMVLREYRRARDATSANLSVDSAAPTETETTINLDETETETEGQSSEP